MGFQKQEEFSFRHVNQSDQPMPGTATPAEWKAMLDSQAEELKATFNKLIDDLETSSDISGAEQIGSKPIVGVQGNKVYDQLVSINKKIQDIVLGEIPDGTITDVKLTDEPDGIKARFSNYQQETNQHFATLDKQVVGSTVYAYKNLGGAL